MTASNYVIVTPARNEGHYLPKTIEAVAAQTIRPRQWIIINDGSTDHTGLIIDAAARRYPWIKAAHRRDRGFRNAGGGVIEAFYEGFELIGEGPWDYLVKLDGDLSFDRCYFASSMQHFAADPKLGIGGGTVCGEVKGVLTEESKGDPAFHVRGASKIYRRACWEEIGGLIKAPGWDTLDEVKANMLGWKTYRFPALKLTHSQCSGNGSA